MMKGMGIAAIQATLGAMKKKMPPMTKHGGQNLHHIAGADIEKALQLVDVIVQYRHQAAGALIFKVRHFQVLHVIVSIDAQVMLQGLRQVAPVDALNIAEDRFQRPDDQRDEAENEELRRKVAHAQPPEQRVSGAAPRYRQPCR